MTATIQTSRQAGRGAPPEATDHFNDAVEVVIAEEEAAHFQLLGSASQSQPTLIHHDEQPPVHTHTHTHTHTFGNHARMSFMQSR
jgi:hypothetical protein